jgi:hypothetical protein
MIIGAGKASAMIVLGYCQLKLYQDMFAMSAIYLWEAKSS